MPILPPAHAEQAQVADQVLQTMGGIHLLSEWPVPESDLLAPLPLVSTLTFSSPASLRLTLECSEALASELAFTFFDLQSPRGVAFPEMADTVAEMVNMIGGNLKALMPEDTRLGLPEVVPPAQPVPRAGQELSSLCLESSAGLLRLTFSEAGVPDESNGAAARSAE